MAFYSIGEIAERCGINPVTLRAWQRRYGLLKPQRSEGGHRQFDEDDIQRIEEIKRWIKSGVPVGKVKALLDKDVVVGPEAWNVVQEEMMGVVRQRGRRRCEPKSPRWCVKTPWTGLSITSFCRYAIG
ncbi:Putative HTH-type transcriptional regulator ycgE [Cronobacter sakazakii 701]|nr:Putative HTH-type transcriptional regulator ycgE [Cronobacter sakazakii 701]